MPPLKNKVQEQLGQPYKNLVFEGGGVWGIAYEGVLFELDELGLLAGIERVAGASAGAITAVLLAVGFRTEELGRLMRKTDFSDFTDDSFGYARDTARLLTEYGWYKGDAFKKWVRRSIKGQILEVSKELGIPKPPTRPTFAQLLAWQKKVRQKGRHLPEFFAVASNLSDQRREVYSAATTPNLRIDDAVRGSMSIPLFFAHAGKRKEVIVDGGLTWNYPVNLFDREPYLSDPTRGYPVSYATAAKQVFNSETLGFRLDTTGELQANLKDWQNEPAKIDNIVQYGWALVTFIRAIANKIHLHKNDWTRTIFVDVGEEIGFTDFDLTSGQQDELSAAGRKGVQEFFQWRTTSKGKKEIAKIYADMA